MFTKEQVINGLSWEGAAMVVQYGIRLLIKLVLAHYLLPEHFGLIGMAGVLVSLVAAYTDLGIGAALIQRSKDKLTSLHWVSVFWFNLAVSWVGFAIIVFILSPLSVTYYGEELLGPLSIGISLGLLWSPLTFIHLLKLKKAMKFKDLFFIYSMSVFLGGFVAIAMAYYGFGVWSFIGQSVSASLVQVPMAWLIVKWKPKLRFSFEAVKDLLAFGGYDILVRLIGFDGKYFIRGSHHGGYETRKALLPKEAWRSVDVGKGALLEADGIEIIVTEGRVGMEQDYYKAAGVDPAERKIVVVKSHQAHRASFERIAKHIIEVDTHGSTSPNYKGLSFKNIPRPVFPLDPM